MEVQHPNKRRSKKTEKENSEKEIISEKSQVNILK